jgi:hypothetical protein
METDWYRMGTAAVAVGCASSEEDLGTRVRIERVGMEGHIATIQSRTGS